MGYYQVARIVNTFGIKGQLKLLLDTDFVEARFAIGNQLTIMDGDQVVKQVILADFKEHKGAYLVKFEGINNINDVEGYKGMSLAISSDQQHALEADTFYHHQIIGLSVVTIQGQDLGHIKEILALGSNDVWVVKPAEKGKKEILLPFIKDVVKKVDLDQKLVTVELMEGLVDED